MDGWFGLLAQVTENTSAVWWNESWAVWGLTLAIILVPTVLAWLVTRRLRAGSLWGRLSVVLVALAAGIVVTVLGWPPRMGIDLKGGVILVYEIDSAKQPDGGVSMDKLVAAVSRRVNPGGQKEVTVRQYGTNQLEVIVPEVDQAEVEFIKRIVSSAGVLEFRIVANPQDPRHKEIIEKATSSSGSLVSSGDRSIGRWIQIDTQKINPVGDSTLVMRQAGDGTPEVLVALDRFDVTGDFLSRASGGYDQNLQPCVNFSFNSQGSALFGTLTSQNLPDPANRLLSRLGIVLDGVLLSAPTIRSTISSDGQITGSFKQADVEFLVGVLNAGSLPAALYSDPISEQKISPQLGADTIRSGARAMLLATIVVLTFMLMYYRFSGIVADLARFVEYCSGRGADDFYQSCLYVSWISWPRAFSRDGCRCECAYLRTDARRTGPRRICSHGYTEWFSAGVFNHCRLKSDNTDYGHCAVLYRHRSTEGFCGHPDPWPVT